MLAFKKQQIDAFWFCFVAMVKILQKSYSKKRRNLLSQISKHLCSNSSDFQNTVRYANIPYSLLYSCAGLLVELPILMWYYYRGRIIGEIGLNCQCAIRKQVCLINTGITKEVVFFQDLRDFNFKNWYIQIFKKPKISTVKITSLLLSTSS